MSVNQKSNFNIVGFFIADYPPVSNNQVLYVNYIEDIRSATMLMDVQITDTESGFLSKLTGMENVFLVIDDSEGRTQLGGDFVIYDIQDRRNVGGKSSAVLMLCTQDFLNNAANKLSRRFGKGLGKKLLNMMIEKSLMHGVKKVTLEVRKDSEAILFYRKLNFSSVDVLPCYYQDGCDGIVMEKQI